MIPSDDPEYRAPEPMSDEQADDINERARQDELDAVHQHAKFDLYMTRFQGAKSEREHFAEFLPKSKP